MSLDFVPPPGVPACELGESPCWLPDERLLLWVDIPGQALHEWRPADGRHRQWALASEPGCVAPLPGGALLLAARDGLWRFDREADDGRGGRERLAPPPYDPAAQRFNDGKCDPQGRLWVATICDDRSRTDGALYRFAGGRLDRMAGGITVGNGLAWSPDGRTLYWSDTAAHRIFAVDFDGHDGSLSRRRDWASFDGKPADGRLDGYGGRPDGAAVDAEGAYWVAMFEGQRLLRLAPDGRLLQSVALPVRCPTMPCFGGDDLRTLFVTTARKQRPVDELAAQPWAGRVLMARVDVPGLPVHHAQP